MEQEPKVRDPQTREEWQAAADAAYFWRLLYDAWLYGLIEPEPAINVERCDQILDEAKKRGITPRKP